MGLAIFRASASGGWVGKYDADYTIAHDSAVGNGKGQGTGGIFTTLSDDYYYIKRGFVDFPSDLLGNNVITAARLVFVCTRKAEADDGHADLHIVQGVQDIPLAFNDFGDHLEKTVSGGSIAFADVGLGADNPNIITLNATGLSWITPDGTTKLCLRLSGDIQDLVPTDVNEVPAAWVTWAGVVTKAATDILPTSATLNGTSRGSTVSSPFLEITYEGNDLEYPRVRFNYGKTTSYGTNTPWQAGVAAFTDFEGGITELEPSTRYYFRAELEDASGTAYGSRLSFVTKGPPTVTTNEATLLQTTSARLNGTVTDDGDATCEYWFRYREAYTDDEYTYTEWANTKETDDTFYEDISDLAEDTTYEFAAQIKNVYAESAWGDTLYFTLGTRCFTIPDLFDDHGRVAKGAWVRAYRVDTFEIVGEGTIDEYGNATICGLPLDVDVIFHVTWGGGA